jgi:hypothetical protein
MLQTELDEHRPQVLSFSNGVTIKYSQIDCVESNQQRIAFPAGAGELMHLLEGRPSRLSVRLCDGSNIDINAGNVRLSIQVTATE